MPESKRGDQIILPPKSEGDLVQAVNRCAWVHISRSAGRLR
jgi:hypothetical protein